MANSINIDKKRRKLYVNYLQKREKLKSIIKDNKKTDFERYNAQLDLQKIPRNSLKARLKKRCVLTGRSQGLVGPFNVSRIKLRKLVSNGQIPGLKKAVW